MVAVEGKGQNQTNLIQKSGIEKERFVETGRSSLRQKSGIFVPG